MEREIELLGLQALIKASKNKTLEDLRGVIVGETKSLLIVDLGGKKKKIIKNQVLLEVEINGKKRLIDGKDLVGTTEERIK